MCTTTQPGVAPSTDPQHLINSWGLTALPTSPFWLSDNGSGFSTLYTGAGVQIPLFVTIPASASSPAGTAGTPTGIVGNISPTATDFTVTEKGKSGQALFIFATLDGTISAWNPAVGRHSSWPEHRHHGSQGMVDWRFVEEAEVPAGPWSVCCRVKREEPRIEDVNLRPRNLWSIEH
jgi:hypothetical protein